MTEYIEREAALESLCTACESVPIEDKEICPFRFTGCQEYANILSLPAADVRPVVRGKWEEREVFTAKGNVDMLQSAFCPVCKRYHTTPYSYFFTVYAFCPNCGADMRGTTNE